MDPFATLGLPRRYDLDLEQLEQRYRDLQRALHPDRHGQAPASERRMKLQKAVEVNEAYRILRDDQRRAEIMLVALSGSSGSAPEPARSADSDLLIEMMELRESLSDARAARDRAAVRALTERVQQERAALQSQLTQGFAALAESSRDEQALARVRALVSRLKYYQRFLDEAAAFEDEAEGS